MAYSNGVLAGNAYSWGIVVKTIGHSLLKRHQRHKT